MERPIKILLVEDEMVVAANISLFLSELGYDVTGILPRGEEALYHIEIEEPDIILMDIRLKGDLDGIATANLIHDQYRMPIIYLVASEDASLFQNINSLNPSDYISKPLEKEDLKRSLKLAVEEIEAREPCRSSKIQTKNPPANFILNDRIFIRHKENMIKIDINNVLYIEADRNYCQIFGNTKKHVLVMSLKDINEKLPQKHFLRIHRSYIINISKIDEIARTYVIIGKKTIPMSKSMRAELFKRLQTI